MTPRNTKARTGPACFPSSGLLANRYAIRAAIDGLGVTIADRHMIGRELAEGQLVQVLNVHVDGHQSYWLITRAGQDELPHVALFRDWLIGSVAPGSVAPPPP